MAATSSSVPSSLPREFRTTRWSVVLASREAESDARQRAFGELCEIYWYPIYAFLRRKGNSREGAADLTQSFFLSALERGTFEKADPGRGRLRSFLLKCVQNHVISTHRAERAGVPGETISFDFSEGERRYRSEPVDHVTAEVLFDRRWALTVIDQALQRIAVELRAKYGLEHADSLMAMLTGSPEATTTDEIARQQGLSLSAVKVRLHRARQRYRELLRWEVAHTLADGEDVDEELRRLSELF